MNFFEYQDKSRKNTALLLFLFLIAVIGIILSIYIVILFFDNPPKALALHELWRPQTFFSVAIVTTVVILVGSGIKMAMLSQGGSVVATMLGGQLVDQSTSNANERKLLNVIEEMSIASGVPMPEVYVLQHEEAINAFAAGHSPNDAAIGVTKGCIEKLNRDELQGVIAHEFSHILNGDMRLNIRLIGMLSGILIIATIGKLLMRSSAVSGSRRNKNQGGAILMGLALLIIGYVGVFIGRIIQSAISRQREFLADASAVQFTRNPSGIGNALKKIGGFSSILTTPRAEEASHMFFSDGISHFISGEMFATHPPLVERIKRIDPTFESEMKAKEASDKEFASQLGTTEPAMAGATSGFAGIKQDQSIPLQAGAVIDMVGKLSDKHISYGSALIKQIPPFLKSEVNTPLGALGVVMAFLLDKNPEERQKQIDILKSGMGDRVVQETLRLAGYMDTLNPSLRLPIVDLAMPPLRQMSKQQYFLFIDSIKQLVEADAKLSLSEYALQKVVKHRLGAAFEKPAQKITYKDHTVLADDFTVVLSALAYAGQSEADKVKSAFEAGSAKVPKISGKLSLLPQDRVSYALLDMSLSKFASASPKVKQYLLDASAYVVMFDREITVEESELYRAMAYSLDCPIPPFIA